MQMPDLLGLVHDIVHEGCGTLLRSVSGPCHVCSTYKVVAKREINFRQVST